MDLFDAHFEEQKLNTAPLAERQRPVSLDDFVGQEHLVGPGKPIRMMLETGRVHSMILWGPPGCGKTTLARLITEYTKAHFVAFSAVTAGVGEVRRIIAEARDRLKFHRQRTILFVDEIHRFNKAQQDAFLPSVEQGIITLIGATTENPSFEVNPPLISRCQVCVLQLLTDEQIYEIVRRIINKEFIEWRFEKSALDHIVKTSNGDARTALNALELAIHISSPNAQHSAQSTQTKNRPRNQELRIRNNRSADMTRFARHKKTLIRDSKFLIQKNVTLAVAEQAVQRKAIYFDKKGDYHYDTISALIKSLRGSDPDAALYWLARMIKAGEDPVFIARRLVIFAAEDIDNADPMAFVLATSCMQAVHMIGPPEAQLILAQTTTYLATAKKSIASMVGLQKAKLDIDENRLEPVPLHLRNAVTNLMKQLGYGQGHLRYPWLAQLHQDSDGREVKKHPQSNLPGNLTNRKYYEPEKYSEK